MPSRPRFVRSRSFLPAAYAADTRPSSPSSSPPPLPPSSSSSLSSLSRKEASIRSVSGPFLYLGKKAGTQESKKKEDGEKKRARSSGLEQEKGETRHTEERKNVGGEREARRVSARWISANFERALTCVKCQSKQKNSRERKDEGLRRGKGRGGSSPWSTRLVGETKGCETRALLRVRTWPCPFAACYMCTYMCKCIHVFKIRRMRGKGNTNGGRSTSE